MNLSHNYLLAKQHIGRKIRVSNADKSEMTRIIENKLVKWLRSFEGINFAVSLITL